MHSLSLSSQHRTLSCLYIYQVRESRPKMRLLLLFCYVRTWLLLPSFMAGLAMSAAAVNNLTTDQSSLLAFKAHVTDHQGVLANNWSSSYTLCSWVGVACGARHRRVVGLNLSDMSLEGTIPPQLGNLSFLMSLDISRNSFHGQLPSELGRLRRLSLVRFSYNKLSGSLPSWIGGLSNLRTLIAQNNSFTAPIPDSLFNLSRLAQLNFMSNLIGGKIPAKVGNLSNLVALNLQDNHLQGEIPTEIGNLQNLKGLNLGVNNLSGPIPPTIFNISTLKVLNLISNQLSGHLPSSIGYSLPNLEFMTLGENKLSGTIPISITNASKLIGLDLISNSLSGFIPNTFGSLRHLEVLSLADNHLTTESSSSRWSFLSSLTSCRNLNSIFISSNPLNGILPPLIGNFSASLQYFYARDCKLGGMIPQEICNLSGLVTLSLYNNALTGNIPTTVGRLQQLQGLALNGNNLQGSIPSNLCRLQRLNGLLLHENQLSGGIPTCLDRLQSLRDLRLDSNKLNYSIPPSFWTLEFILFINLSSNSLRGSLSSNIQNMKVLIELDLSRNELSGDIPPAIGGLKDLSTLSIAHNQFQGPIPQSLGSLTGLESLDLYTNHLSGEIPKSLEALSNLKHLNVSHNKLEGEIPMEGPFRNFTAQSFIGNDALCGPSNLQVPACKEDHKKGSNKAALVVLKYIMPPILSSVLIAMIIIFFIRCRNRGRKNMDQEDLPPLATWKRTSYLDIQRATDGFNECNLLGTGSFGSVYKGTLSDGTNVAIKVFNLQLERGFRSFESECEILRNIRHRNLIKILSSCCNPDFKALVLEFMPNGSLETWLYSHNYFLDIKQRLDIILDVGMAVEYLHSSANVVHCDLKPNNILLDENMVAHVSDFGISKLLGQGDHSVTQTMTMATIGYMAPEFGSEGIVSARCDVYSFGVLLMEMFTRKKPTDEMFIGGMSLKNWVTESLPQELTQVVDANLVAEEKAFSAKMDCFSSLMDLALSCCKDSPDQRILMADAVTKLHKIKEKFKDDVATIK